MRFGLEHNKGNARGTHSLIQSGPLGVSPSLPVQRDESALLLSLGHLKEGLPFLQNRGLHLTHLGRSC